MRTGLRVRDGGRAIVARLQRRGKWASDDDASGLKRGDIDRSIAPFCAAAAEFASATFEAKHNPAAAAALASERPQKFLSLSP